MQVILVVSKRICRCTSEWWHGHRKWRNSKNLLLFMATPFRKSYKNLPGTDVLLEMTGSSLANMSGLRNTRALFKRVCNVNIHSTNITNFSVKVFIIISFILLEHNHSPCKVVSFSCPCTCSKRCQTHIAIWY